MRDTLIATLVPSDKELTTHQPHVASLYKNFRIISSFHSILRRRAVSTLAADLFDEINPEFPATKEMLKTSSGFAVPYVFLVKDPLDEENQRVLAYHYEAEGNLIRFGASVSGSTRLDADIYFSNPKLRGACLENFCLMESDGGEFTFDRDSGDTKIQPRTAEPYGCKLDLEDTIIACFAHAPHLFLSQTLPRDSLVVIDRDRLVIGIPVAEKCDTVSGVVLKPVSLRDPLLLSLPLVCAEKFAFFAVITVSSRTSLTSKKADAEHAVTAFLSERWNGGFESFAKLAENLNCAYEIKVDDNQKNFTGDDTEQLVVRRKGTLLVAGNSFLERHCDTHLSRVMWALDTCDILKIDFRDMLQALLVQKQEFGSICRG